MSASDDDASRGVGVAERPEWLPSPLTFEDGTPVPCSCKVSNVCWLEGGRKASSGYWNLAPTSKAAKFAVQKSGADIKHDGKEKTPGSRLHPRTIPREILAGEELQCSSCYQATRNANGAAAAAVAAAKAAAAAAAALTSIAGDERVVGSGLPSGSPGGSPHAAAALTVLAQPVNAAAQPVAADPAARTTADPAESTAAPSVPSALGKRARKGVNRFDPVQAAQDQQAAMARRKAAAKQPDQIPSSPLPSDHPFASFLRRHVLVWKRAVNCLPSESDWAQAVEGLVDVAKEKQKYVVYNGYELDGSSMTSKCLMLVEQRDFKNTVVDQACRDCLEVFETVLGMEVVQESGCGALVTFQEAGGGIGGSCGAGAHTNDEPRQAHHFDWYRKRLREHNMRAGTILFNPSSSPARLTMAQPVESQTYTRRGEVTGFVASGARLMVTIPAMGAVFFDDLVWHAGVRYEFLDWHLRCHYYLLQRPGGRTSKAPIPAGVNFRNIHAAAAASATELHDGEGYPSASKTFAEPQEELEQQSALGPACDVASLARLLLQLDVAALA